MTAVMDLGQIAPTFSQQQWLAGVFPAMIGQLAEPDPATDPMSAYRYLRTKRDVMEMSARQPAMMRLYDGSMNYVGHLTGELSGQCEELASDSGKATTAIRYNNHLGDYIMNQTKIHEDLHLVIDPIPTQPTWRTRWGGKITGLVGKKDSQGIHTIEIEAISNREHAKNLLFGANPFFPPEVQLPKMWVLPGNTRTILALSMFINLARLFSPLLSVATNVMNPAGWINPLGVDAVANINPLSWPLQVAFVDPLLDQSRTTVLGSTWTDWHSVMAPLLADAGVIFRAYTWLTEDTDTFHTELEGAAKLLGLGQPLTDLVRPTRNCIGFSLEDMSDRKGLTGTAADGLVNAISVTLDDLITPVLVNVQTGQTLNGEPIELASGETRVTLLEQLAGVQQNPPKAIWWDGQFTGILESERRMHKAPVKTTMTGGRSPSLVNQAQTFAIRYALAELSAVISYGIGAAQAPGTPGLDNLYQGQLDNVLFAWQRYTDPLRALFTGDMGFQERIEKGSGTAYTLAGVLTLRVGNYKTRAWQGFTCKVINGHPWLLDIDVRLGEMAGFEQDQIIFVDQITAIKREWDRKKAMTVSMAIGDDSDKEDPFARGMRFLAAAWSTLGQFLGEGTLFG